MTTFPTPDPLRARIEIELGDIRVVAAGSDESVVDVVPTDPSSEKRPAAEQTRVTCTGDRLDVAGPKHSAMIGPTRRPRLESGRRARAGRLGARRPVPRSAS